MERRFEGFTSPHGLYVLDTHTGEVRLIRHGVEGDKSFALPTTTVGFGESVGPAFSSDVKLGAFENEVVSSYPYLVAKPFSDLLNEKDPRLRCKLMVDTFTAVLKYMSLQLASEYLRAQDVKDPEVHRLLTKDLSRPLISSWNLLVARCLPVLSDNNIPMFSPEMKTAYERLETKCKEPFLVSHSYSDENGDLRTKTKKLGKIQAFINYRNGLAHGFNQSQGRAQKEFDEYYPLLRDILQEVRYMSRYTLWHVASSREGVGGVRLMGSSPSMEKVEFNREGLNPEVSPLFLVNHANGEILPLYAFFDFEDSNEAGLPELGKDVFVFDGNTRNTVLYLSLSGEHLEKTSRFSHWKEILAGKELTVEWADASNITLEKLNAIGRHISSAGIQALVTSGKYLREVCIPRHELDEMLESFNYGAYNGFVLGGETGIGKSTLLAQKTEQWQSEGHLVAFYRGSALNQTDISNKFLRDISLKVNYLEDFLSLMGPIFTGAGKKCYIVIDALNEFHGNLGDLIQSIDNTVAQAANHSWFKILVSIRESAYNRVAYRFGTLSREQYFSMEEDKAGEKVSSNVIRLKPISDGSVEQLYNAYRDYKWKDGSEDDSEGYFRFRPLTTFDELDPEGTTVRLMRSPLMTRLLMQSFHRARLPQNLDNDGAMRIYYDNVVLERTDDTPGFPDRKRFLNGLVSELDGKSIERADRDALMGIPSLRPHLVNNQRDSAYIQLLEIGVLMEEWEGDLCHVRFAFDRFLEFLLAEHHWPRINDVDALLSLTRRSVSFKILQGALETILSRLCVGKQLSFLVELIDRADGESEAIKTLVRETAVRLLYTLSNEHHGVFLEAIREFPKKPGELDLLIFSDLLQKLFMTGNMKSYEKAYVAAMEEAQALDDSKFLSDFMLYDVEYDLLSGKYKDARDKLNQVLVLKQGISDHVGEVRTLKTLGNLEYKEGDYPKALELYEKALGQSVKSGFDNISSNLLNNIAVIKKSQGKLSEAEDLYNQSLLIKRKNGDNRMIGRTLRNIGVLKKELGQTEEAEKLYNEALSCDKKIGNRQGVSHSLDNLASLYRIKGKIDKAERMFHESLLIKRQLGDLEGIGDALESLAILKAIRGDYPEAEEMYTESLEIHRRIGYKKGVLSTLDNLGFLYYMQGKNAEAENLYQESLLLGRQMGNDRWISATLNKLGLLRMEQSELDKAETFFNDALEIRKALGYKQGISETLSNLGLLYMATGRIEQAETILLDSLVVGNQLGYQVSVSKTLNSLGNLYRRMDDYSKAEKYLLDSLQISREFDYRKGMSDTLNDLGLLHRQKGMRIEAEKCLLESLEIRKRLGNVKKINETLENLETLYNEMGHSDKAEMLKREKHW